MTIVTRSESQAKKNQLHDTCWMDGRYGVFVLYCSEPGVTSVGRVRCDCVGGYSPDLTAIMPLIRRGPGCYLDLNTANFFLGFS